MNSRSSKGASSKTEPAAAGILFRIIDAPAIVVGALLCISVFQNAQAASATYTWTATGTGVLGANSFTDSIFNLIAAADTDNISIPTPGIVRVNNVTATISVSGAGSGTFTIPTISVDNQNNSRVGLGAPDQGLAILFVDNPAFAGYDLRTSIGPISGSPAFNPGASFSTTSGTFSLGEVSMVTFEAVVIPEPTTFTLLGLGSLMLVIIRRRR